MSNLQTAFDNLISEQRELQKKFQETAQKLFMETTKEFFNLNPKCTGIIWTQYTPYFNDGDTCEFNVHEPSFTNAPDPESVKWGEYDGDEETAADGSEIFVYDGWGSFPDMFDQTSCDSFSNMIQSSEMEDVMKAMFGDHVRVVATREGFDVTEYDHD
jgi:hypothetical protein